MKKHLIAGALVLSALLPFLASAQSADIQAQINSILAQIAAIQARINALTVAGAGTATPPPPPPASGSTGLRDGDRVRTITNLRIRSAPSVTGSVLGTAPFNAQGTIRCSSAGSIACPTTINDLTWWYIQWDGSLPAGWSVQGSSEADYLVSASLQNASGSTASTNVGTRGVNITSAHAGNYNEFVIEGTGFTKSGNIIKIDNGYIWPTYLTDAPKLDAECNQAKYKECSDALYQQSLQGAARGVCTQHGEGGGSAIVCPPGVVTGSGAGCYLSAAAACPYKGDPNPRLSVYINSFGVLGFTTTPGFVCSDITKSPYTGIKLSGHKIVLEPGPHQLSVENANGTSNIIIYTATDDYVGYILKITEEARTNAANAISRPADNPIIRGLEQYIATYTQSLQSLQQKLADTTDPALQKALAEKIGGVEETIAGARVRIERMKMQDQIAWDQRIRLLNEPSPTRESIKASIEAQLCR